MSDDIKNIKRAVIRLKNKMERFTESFYDDLEHIIILIEAEEMDSAGNLCGKNGEILAQDGK